LILILLICTLILRYKAKIIKLFTRLSNKLWILPCGSSVFV